MTDLSGFLLKIGQVAVSPELGAGTMHIVIKPPYKDLMEEMSSTFSGHEDVTVLVDRRNGERRSKEQAIATERRHSVRRRKKESIVEVILYV